MTELATATLNDEAMMLRHVQALFTCDAEGRLVAVNEVGGGPAPRFFLGLTPSGPAYWVRHDLEAGLVQELGELFESVSSKAVGSHLAVKEAFVGCLAKAAPVEHVWTGPTYRFPPVLRPGEGVVRVTAANSQVLRPYFEDWLKDVQADLPFAAVLKEGKAVSVCHSARMTAEADEAGVETHAEFRGKGYAGQAVAAWAGFVRESGRAPLYSTSWENRASQSVARKLGLLRFGADLHIT